MCEEYLLIGGGVGAVSLLLVPQDFLRVQVQSLQLPDQMALLGRVLRTLPVQGLHL